MSIKVSEPTQIKTGHPLVVCLSSNTARAQTLLARSLAAVDIDMSNCYVVYNATNQANLYTYIESVISHVSAIMVCGKTSLLKYMNKKQISRRDGEVAIHACEEYSRYVLFTYSPMEVAVNMEYRYNFNAHLQYFQLLADNSYATLKADYNFDFSTVSLQSAQALMQRTKRIAYDIESTGLDPAIHKLTMLGLAGRLREECGGGTWTALIPPKGGAYPVEGAWSDDMWASLMQCAPRAVTGHHTRFDNNFLREKGFVAPVPLTDTMHLANLENELQSKKLKHLLRAKLGAEPYEIGINFDPSQSYNVIGDYCRKDCLGTLLLDEYYEGNGFPTQDVTGVHLPQKLLPHGDDRNKLVDYIMGVERMLQRIEARGVYIPQDKLADTLKAVEIEQAQLKDKLDAITAKLGVTGVNYASPVQLQKLLYTTMKMPVVYKDEVAIDEEDDDEDAHAPVTHTPTTNAAALKALAHKGHEFCTLLLEYRKLSKMISGFLTPWQDILDTREDGRLHPSYHSAKVRTFRLSSSGINLQQVSRDPRIRTLIAAPPGRVFIEADHSQIELRVASVIGNIRSMQKIYRAGGDIHTSTATALAAMHGEAWASLDKKTQKQYRTRAKAVNFGFIYGMYEKGFQQYAAASYDLYLTLAEARNFRDAFFGLYPELPDWHKRAKDEALNTGVARLYTGRIRHLPNVYSTNEHLRSKALRQAINTPVQGLASEIMLAGMLDLDYSLPDYAQIVGQCHDAVFVECDDDPYAVDTVCRCINEALTGVMTKHPLLRNIPWPIPLSVEIKVGNAWGDPNATIFSTTP